MKGVRVNRLTVYFQPATYLYRTFVAKVEDKAGFCMVTHS